MQTRTMIGSSHSVMLRRTAMLWAAALLVACSSGPARMTPPAAAAPTRTSGSAALEQGESAAIARARADSVRYPYTAADIAFMSGMIHHHAQAIVMARLAPGHGASPAVQRLADRIISAQQDEIITMQRWLRDRQQPVPQAVPGPMKMMMNGMEHEMMMPGMLTDEQMHTLEAAHDKEFDRIFLTDMIQHHRGATSMVRALFGTYGAAQDETIFKFANDVNVDQTTEIARMERLLAANVLGIEAP